MFVIVFEGTTFIVDGPFDTYFEAMCVLFENITLCECGLDTVLEIMIL